MEQEPPLESQSAFKHMNFTPMTEAVAHQIVAWRYPPPYEIYNVSASQHTSVTRNLLDPKNRYECVYHDDLGLMGFACFGADAQVPGGQYKKGAIDIGVGMRPALTGGGWGRDFVKAVRAQARVYFPKLPGRVTIAAFNKRAQLPWQGLGFVETMRFNRASDGQTFVLFVEHVVKRI